MSGNNLMLRDALALLEYASSRGVFKLNHYSLVSGTHGSLFPVCKSESAVSAPVESLKNLVKLWGEMFSGIISPSGILCSGL